MSNKITYQREAFCDIMEGLEKLTQLHWEEVAVNKDKIKLNPDYKTYLSMCDAGVLKTYTAREGEDLVGYFIVVVTPSLHYKDHVFATNDVLYLREDLRGKLVGRDLISFCEEDLKKDGVSTLTINMKVSHPFDKLCEHMGYSLIERVYSKYLLQD